MSLSPVALEALRAARSAFSESEADVFEDALVRGLEAVDREGRLVGAHAAAELERLRESLAEERKGRAEDIEAVWAAIERLDVGKSQLIAELWARVAELAGLLAASGVPEPEPEPEGVHHAYLLGRDLPETGGAR